MNFFRTSNKQNFDIYSGYTWYVPGIKGMFIMLGWLLAGTLAGSLITSAFTLFVGRNATMTYGMLISYPMMFIPPMIAAKYASSKNMMFEKGYALDSNHFEPIGGWAMAGLLIITTIACSFPIDFLSSLLPPIPKYLEDILKSMIQGNFFVNFLCVSIFAPFFEEWLCRGIVLRGLLNHKKKDGSKMRPVWAITISSLFFAVIHMNPWQAIPAFIIGMLMGYVYYKTGSLKLTMLIHFVNNTTALIMCNIASFKDADSWLDVMPEKTFAIICIAAVLFIAYVCFAIINKIEPIHEEGSCDAIEPEEMTRPL